MEVTKDNITITYNGHGNETVTASATVNEGIDKNTTFTFKAAGAEDVVVTVNQEGKREIFNNDFVLSDGGTYNVIKAQYNV